MLAALAITAMLASFFIPMVSQILIRWTSGQQELEAADQIMRASISLQTEISSVEMMPLPAPANASPDKKELSVWFKGTSDTLSFIHTTAAADGGTKLETLAFTIDEGGDGTTLVRRTADYDPGAADADPRTFGTPNAVISGAGRMSFAYVAHDGTRSGDWLDHADLPARVELTIRPPGERQGLPAPIVLVVATRGKLS